MMPSQPMTSWVYYKVCTNHTENTTTVFYLSLGVLTINISNIPMPTKTAAACGLKRQPSDFINLFEVEKVRGWFPAKGITKDGKMGQTVRVRLLNHKSWTFNLNLYFVGKS